MFLSIQDRDKEGHLKSKRETFFDEAKNMSPQFTKNVSRILKSGNSEELEKAKIPHELQEMG